MKPRKYRKEILKKMDDQNRVTCEDCGRKDNMGHGIVDHQSGTVRVVCHICFVSKYEDGLYGKSSNA